MDQNLTKAGLIAIAVVGLLLLMQMNQTAMSWLEVQFNQVFQFGG